MEIRDMTMNGGYNDGSVNVGIVFGYLDENGCLHGKNIIKFF